MTKYRYSLPFAFLALVPIGIWLRGPWTFLAAVLTPVTLVLLDATLGAEHASDDAGDATGRMLPRVFIPMQLAVTALVAWWIGCRSPTLTEALGLVASTGMTAGVFGFLAAHEMIHSTDGRERGLGLMFLASAFYMHFRIAHIYGHHRHAATPDDPATARRGERLYDFLVRTIVGQFGEAWTFETRRLRRKGHHPLAAGNRMVAYILIELTIAATVALVSPRALLFLVTTAMIAVVLLETFNYVAHYGMQRRLLPSGRYERLGPQHSWNSRHWMNNAALFNMGRHSDHHRQTTRSFEKLRSVHDEAELPFGYAGAIVTAFIPPLWRRVMDVRIDARPERLPRDYLPSA